MAKDLEHLPCSPDYPKDGNYSDLLEWHLTYWGTRPGGNTLANGKPWKLKDFRETAFVADGDNAARVGFGNWLATNKPPNSSPNEQNHTSILKALFGDPIEPQYARWRRNLDSARERCDIGRNERTVRFPDPPPIAQANGKYGSISSDFATAPRESAHFVPNRLNDFFGRDDHIRAIDALVDARMAGERDGLFVITAPAGFGKSAFAVNWCDRADEKPGRKVAKHFCSFSSGPPSNALVNVYDHLHWQVAQALGQPLGQAGDTSGLMRLLQTTPPEGEELVVWLDGIDEADGTVDCFLPDKLGERICVIVSARANDNVTPAYLDPWLEQDMAKSHNPHRHSLTKLSQTDVGKLVDGLFAKQKLVAPAGLHDRIYRASDGGYALFAKNMAESAINAVQSHNKIDLGQAPETLRGYAESELDRLARHPQWHEYQPLFAFLTIAKDPVPINKLPKLLGHPRKRVFPQSFPYQLRRWLSITEASDTQSALLSFAHPLLADVFGGALGSQRQDAIDDLCDTMLPQHYTQWPEYVLQHLPRHLLDAGRADETVTHLTRMDFIEARFATFGSEASPALMSTDWLAWYNLGNKNDNAISTPINSIRHLRFWNHYVADLIKLAHSHAELWRQLMHDVGLTISSPRDSLLAPQHHLLTTSLVLRGHSAAVRGMLAAPSNGGFLSWSDDGTLRLWGITGAERAVLRGHGGPIDGALLLTDGSGFLSWNRDGILQLWSWAGEERAKVDLYNDSSGRMDVLPDGIGFFVWSDEKTLRFLDSAGQERAVLRSYRNQRHVREQLVLTDYAGSAYSRARALRSSDASGVGHFVLGEHRNQIVSGLMELGNSSGFLSWGEDEKLLLWGPAGEKRAVMDRHHGYVRGALELPENKGFVSWSAFGELQLWGPTGEHCARLGHASLFIDSALVLENGTILTTDRSGELRLWGAIDEKRFPKSGHDHAILGMLVLRNAQGFLSWSMDHTLRLWGGTGKERQALQGHIGPVNGALALADRSGFLSWSRDKTLRLWRDDGETRSILEGHGGEIGGALELANGAGFLSWSDDRTLRLWGPFGEKQEVFHGHNGDILGAKQVTGGLNFFTWGEDTLPLWPVEDLKNSSGFISWSEDHTLRLWGQKGEERAVLYGHTDSIGGALVIENGVAFLSWSHDKTLRLWGRWGEERAILRGHLDEVRGALALTNGDGFLSWSKDGSLRLWGPLGETGRVLRGDASSVKGALELQDDQGFLSWSGSGVLRLWSPVGDEYAVLHGHRGEVLGAIELPNAAGFLSWSNDRTLRRWDRSGNLRGTWLSPDGFITAVERYLDCDQYAVIFGDNIGIVRISVS